MPVQEQSQQSKDVKGGTKGEPKPVQHSRDKDQAKKATPAQPASHDMKVRSGIVSAAAHQDAITEVTRSVPAGEPDQLANNDDLKFIGKRITRLDGPAKTTGRARYTADVYLPGMLYGAMITSTMPHARIRSIDVTKAKAYPGVKGVYILQHLSDMAEVKDKSKEMASKYPIVRFAGQPVGGIAATSQAAANEAVKLIKIDYEQLAFVTSVEDARRPDAPLVYPAPAAMAATAGGGGGEEDVPQKGNVRGPARSRRGGPHGDLEKGFAEADAVVEGDYRTQVQTHCSLETHGVVADWKPEMLTVYASTQGTSTVRDEMAEVFGIPKAKVRVITEYMGGGFGAKFGAGNFGVTAAALSKQTGAPVKMMLSRKQEQLSSGTVLTRVFI